LVHAECAEVVEAVGGGPECLDVARGVDQDGGSVRVDGNAGAVCRWQDDRMPLGRNAELSLLVQMKVVAGQGDQLGEGETGSVPQHEEQRVPAAEHRGGPAADRYAVERLVDDCRVGCGLSGGRQCRDGGLQGRIGAGWPVVMFEVDAVDRGQAAGLGGRPCRVFGQELKDRRRAGSGLCSMASHQTQKASQSAS